MIFSFLKSGFRMCFLPACLLFGSFFTNSLHAQQHFDTNYTPLVSSGALPEEFIRTARSLSEEEIKNIPYGPDKSVKNQFAMANNYFLKDLLLSGDVLVNDPLTIYVNKVADELLKQQPQVRQSLHIYVTKSPDVNAYAFDKGFIFVNVGLLAQLENEAQLAYILAHEITHVIKKHSVNEYIENVRMENGTGNYSRGSSEDQLLARYRFSKEQESEADMEGLKLIKQTGYSIRALSGAFDVMQYSYLPFEIIDFKKSFFEDEYLKLPDTLFLKEVADIKANDDYDDSKSTHPNIRKRRGAIEPELKVEDESSRKKYIVSEEGFKMVRENARFECCKLYLADRDYVNAIYAAYILSQKYPDNVYLKKVIAKGFYNILANKGGGSRINNNKTVISIGDGRISSGDEKMPDYTTIEGASQRLYYMLQTMDAKELNTMALSYTFRAHKQHPGDAVLSSLTDSLFSVMVNRNSLFLNDFSRKTKAELKLADTAKAVTVQEEQEESKYSKIKKQQEKAEVAVEDNFMKYAFVGLLKDEEFVARYSKIAKGLTQKPLESNDSYVRIEVSGKKKSNEVPFLGIEKVAFLDPFYMRVKNERGRTLVNYYESEDQQQVLADVQRKCAGRLKMQFAEITTKNITTSDIEKYNDNALLNDWLGERFNHGNNTEEMMTTAEYIQPLIEKLGTKYIAWSGVYNSKGKVYRNTYFFILLDLETGTLMKYEARSARSRDTKDLISSYVYNSLMHVNKVKKN